jgi:hypothetical protein
MKIQDSQGLQVLERVVWRAEPFKIGLTKKGRHCTLSAEQKLHISGERFRRDCLMAAPKGKTQQTLRQKD